MTNNFPLQIVVDKVSPFTSFFFFMPNPLENLRKGQNHNISDILKIEPFKAITFHLWKNVLVS